MTIFRRYTPAARHTMIRAALLSLDGGRRVLDEDAVLLALAETRPFAGQLDAFTLEPEAIRPGIVAAGDRELLAGLGIDLDGVRRRMSALVPMDDPSRWHLRRSPARPLRVTLSGPPGDLPLTSRARKVIEVAAHYGGTAVTGEDLLRGLLADARNRSVSLMRRNGVPLRPLAAALGLLPQAA
ncbi:hypothetical protein ABGB17_24710 [Sphaerisporangium sp. B11E5]|uniref:hypothetical protein n=1 Tax=Sphaerisporangium sp. B11E5 TaxID=3153563 RepID=UPI00325E2F3A